MKHLISLAVLIIASPAAAQGKDGFDLSGSIRLRYEHIDGQARAGVPPAEGLTELRTILSAAYRRGPLMIGGDVIDSRALDIRNPSAATTSEINVIEPVQLYIGYEFGRRGGSFSGRVQAGRMMLDLGSRRLVARDDYRNTVQGFNGIRVDVASGKDFQATMVYVLPQQRLPSDPAGLRRGVVQLDYDGLDQRLWGGVATRRRLIGNAAVDLTFYRFEERDRRNVATRDRRLSTFGIRFFRASSPGAVDYDIEGFRQNGQIKASLAPTAAKIPVSAWFGHIRLGYQWQARWRPHLAFELDYASGDQVGGKYGRFDTLFGMRRADFGPAGLYNATTRINIVSPGLRLDVTPSKRVDALATVKGLWLASRYDAFSSTGVVDPTGRSGRYAGTQIDGRIRWWAIPKRLELEADGTWIAKGRFLRTAPNRASSEDTRYLSLNASVFF